MALPRLSPTDLAFPNGMVLTPDGRTLIVAESMMNRLSAFDVTDRFTRRSPDVGGLRRSSDVDEL